MRTIEEGFSCGDYDLPLWEQIMKVTEQTLAELALLLRAERKRQKLSRQTAAAVCGVSMSFIRDAESNPENCTLGKLVRYINGLGLGADLHKRGAPEPALPRTYDFGVPDSQLVVRGA